MGMPASAPHVTTIEELLALPDDGQRHELLNGVHVVTPAPRPLHQVAVRDLYDALQPIVRASGGCHLLWSPADIVLGPKSLVQPDLFVVRLREGRRLEQWSDVGVPVVAIEVISPTTAARDRGSKRKIYQRAGVAEYWIVDLDARILERWRPGDERPEIADGSFEVNLSGCAAGTIDLSALFDRILTM